MPTQERLRELFDYQDGKLITRHTKKQGRRARTIIGGLNGRYLYAWVEGKYAPIHRLIWVWHNGPISSGLLVDHINHDRLNNRIENLRLVDHVNNGRNRRIHSNSPTGVFGVRFRDGRWQASIALGAYDTKEEAVAIRRKVEQLLGFHTNHGRMV